MTPRSHRKRIAGFTMLEILFAIIFLTVGLTALFSMFTFSNRGTLDSYRETMAYALAQEAMEWVSGLGYEKLMEVELNPGSSLSDSLDLGNFQDVGNSQYDDGARIGYPEDFLQFERKIEFVKDRDSDRLKVLLIRVTVRPKEGFTIIRREGGAVVLEKIVGAEYGN